MHRPDFSNIELNLDRKIAQRSERKWISPEQIEIKENYCSKDIIDTDSGRDTNAINIIKRDMNALYNDLDSQDNQRAYQDYLSSQEYQDYLSDTASYEKSLESEELQDKLGNEDFLTAMKRELFEETSIKNIKVLKVLDGWYQYELPEELLGIIWKGKFRGQKQKWFIAKFLGEEKEINLNTSNPEFIEWKWIYPNELPEVIVDFKRDLYKKL